MLSKRVSATKTLSSVIPKVYDDITGFINVKIDPYRCIPLTRAGALMKEGVSFLLKLFWGHFECEKCYTSLGISIEVKCTLM